MNPNVRKLSVDRWLPALTLAACLVGCTQQGTTTPDSGTPTVDAGCAGVPGCECSAGACSVGECLDGTCVDCQRGEAACTCRSNNTCNAGLRCNATGLCETCPAGTAGCACDSGDTCGTRLLCTGGTCVADTCVAGSPTCPCRASAPACDGAAYCDGMGLCQACSNDVVGCPCSSGACSGSTVCDTGSSLCRTPVTCAERLAAGACLPHQACVQANGADAACVPMTCEAQFKWDGTGCVACVTQDCAAEPSCADLNGGLGSTCASQNRACVQSGSAAACGACLSGFTGGLTGPCQPAPLCGSVTCAPDQYCDRSGMTPTCLALPCPVGQAQSTGGTCTACTRSCTGNGLSGRNWPFRTATDICVCETLDGYFFASSGGAPIQCDADGDGWVREEADAPPIQAEPALRANARCNITRVSRVRLVDEYGISVDVLSCTEGLKKASVANPDGGVPNGGLGLFPDGGLVPGANGAGACTGFVSLRLLETLANDVPGTPRGASAPPYGGRPLEAAELNSLTKACVSAGADFNDNAVEDMNEIQGTVAPTRPSVEADRLLLEQFAYFVELQAAAAENGVLVIRERSRCDATFPLRYDPSVALDGGVPFPSDLYSLDNDKPYWRSCSRNRDPAYNAMSATPGFDFAQWSCNEVQGGCTNLPPPPHPLLQGPTDPSVLLMRDHGLCRLNGLPPADGLWRGMTHHSQFKCVNVLAGAVSNPHPYDRLPADFGVESNLLTFNQCSARSCATPGDPECSRPQGNGAHARQPVIDCVAVASPPSGSAGFAAVNHRPYRWSPAPGSEAEYLGWPAYYQGGCVNEDDDAWQPYLCPYPDFTSIKSNADTNFGRYSCYKYEPNFLWAGELPDGGSNVTFRSNLYWAPDIRNSVWGPRPPPDGGL